MTSGPDDDPEGLQALLDDGNLTEMTRHALSLDAGVGADAAGGGGAGGSVAGDAAADGAGGLAGSGGSVGTDAGFGGSGGSAGMGGMGGMGGSRPRDGGRPEPVGPTGNWTFDDCNDFRAELFDSSFNGHTAFRSVRVGCTEGIDGQAVTLPNPRDLVYVPDQPSFTFESGVTIAAWVKPSALAGVHTIARKREGGTSSFALVLNEKRFQFIIARTGAFPVAVSATAARRDVWTHVAATYDGTFLRLYIDGSEAASTRAAGVIDPGEGPLLLGNDGSLRRFAGSLDSVWFATFAAPADTVRGLTCLRRAPSVAGSPLMSPPTPPETPFTYMVRITNNHSATCEPEQFGFQINTFLPDFNIEPQFTFVGPIASGESAELALTVTAGSDVEPGSFPIPFSAFSLQNFLVGSGEVTHVVSSGGCRVLSRRELMIRDVSVVDDPVRTTFMAPTSDARRGAWTFGRLMTEMAPRPEEAPDMVEALFKTWLAPQMINGFTLDARPALQRLVLDAWPRRSDGKLNLERAPLRLLAVVNRLDLRALANHSAGEGRFVFGVLDPQGFPLQFTLILEYRLPADTEADILRWANDWHALGAQPFPSEAYNAALQALTDRFSGRGVLPGRPNGSALLALRTNEIALASQWQLREFVLDASTGLLRPDTIKLTPDRRFNGTSTLADFVNANETAILAERHDVPLSFQGAPFLAAGILNELNGWRAPGINNSLARHKFSLNTCNGCHSAEETGTFFLQVSPRFPGESSSLSGFLTGTTVFDRVTGEVRTFNDLDRRRRDLHALVCPSDPLPPPPAPPDAGIKPPRPISDAGAPDPSPAPPPMMTTTTTTVSTGIRRVH